MNYALRNTIMLFIVFLILAGGAYGWLYFQFGGKVEEYEQQAGTKQKRLEELQALLADFDYFQMKLAKVKRKWEYFPKVIPPERNIQDTYKYLEHIARGDAYFDYDYKQISVERSPEIVYSTFQLKGRGRYSNIVNFISRLEEGKPLYKVETVQFRRGGQKLYEGDVEVDVKFKGLFAGENMEEVKMPADLFQPEKFDRKRMRDPFRPLVMDVLPPNTANLLDVSRAKVIALTPRTAYIMHQSGEMLSMEVGDKVYLGTLKSINVNSGEVTFTMNRGGIYETVILKSETSVRKRR